MLLGCSLHSYKDFLFNVHFEVKASCVSSPVSLTPLIEISLLLYTDNKLSPCLRINENPGQGLITGVNTKL